MIRDSNEDAINVRLMAVEHLVSELWALKYLDCGRDPAEEAATHRANIRKMTNEIEAPLGEAKKLIAAIDHLIEVAGQIATEIADAKRA
jgi:hypothetical protein